MGNVLRIADKPPISVDRSCSVLDAVRTMTQKRIGAVLVLDDGRAAGIFTERDVMGKVVLNRLDLETTHVADVMTSPVLTVRADADDATVLALMAEKHIRHVPVVDVE